MSKKYIFISEDSLQHLLYNQRELCATTYRQDSFDLTFVEAKIRENILLAPIPDYSGLLTEIDPLEENSPEAFPSIEKAEAQADQFGKLRSESERERALHRGFMECYKWLLPFMQQMNINRIINKHF
jgi:hypothetical protein